MNGTPATGAEALLLDFGNVLVPIDFGRAHAHWARAANVPTSHVAARFAFDEPLRTYERGEIDAAAYFVHLRNALAIDLPDAALQAGWNSIFLQPDPAVERLLEELSGRYPLYLFSNTNRAHLACWAPRHERMLARFKAVYTSCEIGLRKPDEQAFAHVARLMGFAPDRIAFFDDLAENVEGARRAGLQAFHVRSAADIRRALP